MASAFPGQVSAVQVGTYFVGQYYPFLQQKPDLVHQFYTNLSTMIRVDGSMNVTATGMEDIHNLIVSLNYTEIEIKTAHSLDSWNGGVLVMVSGFVQAKDFICRREFVQTFFLAPQEKGYFVLNDIFLLLEEEQAYQHPVSILEHSSYDMQLNALDHVQEPVSNYMLGEDIQTRDFISSPILEEENIEVDNYPVLEELHQDPDLDERVDETHPELHNVSISNVLDIVQDPPPAEEPVGEPVKHTYASILRTAKSQAASHPTSMNKTVPVLSEWQHNPNTTFQQQAQPSVPNKYSPEVLDEVSAFEDEGESKSVYVGNLPASISTSDLEQEFRNFGRIKPDGVTIRSRKEAGVFYAFIEFEDAVGVHNALKASPVQINGLLIHVEGRRPNSGASRGGRRGRGRVGYHSESLRGQFGGRSYSRGSGLDNGRDHSNRPRGNGYLQRAARSERGVLGSQFPMNGGSQTDALA